MIKYEKNFLEMQEKFAIVARFSAIMDEHTCPLCKFLNDRVITLDNPDYRRFTPPLHYHMEGDNHTKCRCFWTYISKNEKPKVNWVHPSQELITKYYRKK